VNVGRLSVPQPSFRIQVKENLECGESFVSLLDIGVQCDETSNTVEVALVVNQPTLGDLLLVEIWGMNFNLR